MKWREAMGVLCEENSNDSVTPVSFTGVGWDQLYYTVWIVGRWQDHSKNYE